MTVKSIAGSQFTFKVGATAYSDQVLSGTVVLTPTVSRRKTLGGVSLKKVDSVHSGTAVFLFDEEDGMYGALHTAAVAGTALTVEIVGGDSKWTGSVMVDSLDCAYKADGDAESTLSFIGDLTLADVT